MPGRLLTFEGGEGTGKSTLIRGVAERLGALGIRVVVTREPGGTPLAETVRNIALHPGDDQEWSPLAEALLMNAARSDHLDKLIRPALQQDQWVLCDRFADSTRVYQSVAAGVPAEVLHQLESFVVQDTKPDLTFILDAPYETAVERRVARGAEIEDVFERKPEDFHQAVRSAFLHIARTEPERCTVIDAAPAQDVVLESAWRVLTQKFALESA